MLVEQKLESSEGFGKGRKVHMTFGQLVQQLHKGNDSLYLTTQEVSHMHMLLHQSIHCLFVLYSKCCGTEAVLDISMYLVHC